MNNNTEFTTEQKREMGKISLFDSTGTNESKQYGLKLLIEACNENDPEATYIIARLLLDNVITCNTSDKVSHALSLMRNAANNGCMQARTFLNAYCEKRYQNEYGGVTVDPSKPLVDFNGKRIRINRKGVFAPIDAVLSFKDGKNILTLSTNIVFIPGEGIEDVERFKQAVYKGFLKWQGDYEVFGGQKLTVKVVLTNNDNIYDNVIVMPITDSISSTITSFTNKFGTKKRKAKISETMEHKRSFAITGLKWSVNSRKIIYIQSENGKFNDYDEIMHIAKHEFGHALGLGDLYANKFDEFDGVEKGTYSELDSYAITDKTYNLVMCDHHGPISNNDIEMVVLAFRENKIQLYQKFKSKRKISSALGRGN